jgi:hypothetical protein
MKTLFRRLQRLEARVRAADHSHSVLIQFVDVDMSVTSTLTMEASKPPLWTHFAPGTGAHSAGPRPQ